METVGHTSGAEPGKETISHTVGFDNLVQQVKASGETDDLNALYRAFLTLSEWSFVSPDRPDIENAKPFIGEVDGKPWLFVFTDADKVHDFCRYNPGFLNKEGGAYIIRMTVKGSVEMMLELHRRGVFGIRVNEGENGWFCPIENIPAILSFLEISL